MPDQKREYNGQYAYNGNLERMCVCGHAFGHHGGGSPADCLVYSFPENERKEWVNGDKPNCGCEKFRLSRKKTTATEQEKG